MSAHIFAVVNQKGGVGKTTTAINLATAFALAGRRVLLVDCDPQGNCTSGIGLDRKQLSADLYSVLLNGEPAAKAIQQSKVANLHVLPATIHLAGAEIGLVNQMSREMRLARALEPVAESYDYILLDGPPSLSLLTVNVLAAADEVLLPIQCEYFALEGLSQLVHTVDLIRQNLNSRLRIRLVVLTMFDARTQLSKAVEKEVRAFFGEKVSDTVIPRNVRLSEAPSHGMPIQLYDGNSRGAKAYDRLAKELLNGQTGFGTGTL